MKLIVIPGSYGETYAKENGIAYRYVGDNDDDYDDDDDYDRVGREKVEFIGDYTAGGKPVFTNGMNSVRFRITYEDGTTEDLSADDWKTKNGEEIEVDYSGYTPSGLQCYNGSYEVFLDGSSCLKQDIMVWNLGENVKSFSKPGTTQTVKQAVGTTEKILLLCQETGNYTLRYTNSTNKEKGVKFMVNREDGSATGGNISPFTGFTGTMKTAHEANIPLQMEAGQSYVVTIDRASDSDSTESLDYELYFAKQPAVTGIKVKNDDYVVKAGGNNWWGLSGWAFEVTYSDGSVQHLHGPRGIHPETEKTNPYLPYDDYGNSFTFALKDKNQKADFDNLVAGEYPVTITVSNGKVFEDVLKIQGTSTEKPQNKPVSIKKAAVTLSKATCAYTGKAQKPKVTSVKLGNTALTLDKDYTVSYKNNTNIGKATVIITGKGNYTGTAAKTFTISAKKGSSFTVGAYKYKVTGSSTVAFTGLKSSKTTKVTIPKTVKIGGKTFKVTTVANNALKKQKKVTSITIGVNVTSIGTSAFEGCSKLSKVTIGNNVTKIGANAFKNCKKLGTITIKSTKLKSVGKNAFKGIKSNAKIKVPAKKLNAYKKLLKGKGQGKKVKIVK